MKRRNSITVMMSNDNIVDIDPSEIAKPRIVNVIGT